MARRIARSPQVASVEYSLGRKRYGLEQGKESDITLAFFEDQAALLRSESQLWKTRRVSRKLFQARDILRYTGKREGRLARGQQASWSPLYEARKTALCSRGLWGTRVIQNRGFLKKWK